MLSPHSPYFNQVKLLTSTLPFIAQEQCFALKGGTAINLFISDMPRLSVDIDLVYLPLYSRIESLENIAQALQRIASNLQRAYKHISITPQSQEGYTSKLIIHSHRTQIKIEVSLVMRGSIYPPLLMQSSLTHQANFGFVEIQVLHHNDLFAGKICASLDRQHPRDLFDMQEFLDKSEITDELFNTFVVYLLSSNQSISKLLFPNLLDIKATYHSQFEGMALRPTSLHSLLECRSKLITTLHSKLSTEICEFLLSFKQGNPKWEMFPLPQAQLLPSIQWKLENIKKMPKDTKKKMIDKLKNLLSESGLWIG